MTAAPTLLTDDLTGLLTRKAFLSEFERLLAEARTSEQPLTLVLLDVDHFKSVNDTYGHVAGDNTLVTIAETARSYIGEETVAARYGGDEFAALMTGVEREQAFLTFERLRAGVEQAQVPGGENRPPIGGLTISCGAASFPIDGRTVSELLRKADQALYRAKVAGRNQVRLAYEERMTPKTSHYTQTQLERLSKLAGEKGVGEAELLREALDDLLTKYGVNEIER